MENDFFLNTGIAQLLHYEPSNGDLNSSSDCFYISPNWEKSTDQNHHHHHHNHFDSALSSMVSSPVASNSNLSGESFVIRELIGKLGNTSAEISGYTTPANSPPKHSHASAPAVAVADFCATDPGFAERAARFSCFGSRSFNGRPGPVPSRVSSSPSLKDLGSGASSEQNQSPIIPNDTDNNNNNNNTRKRKASASKAKPKELPISKVSEINEKSNSKLNNAKRNKGNEEEEGGGEEEEEEESKGINSGDEKEKNNSPKPPEPPKDYIHVRARRGQATDSHSLAERVRREKISERMKLLQDLVPGCNKVTGKALMLDEIINYVQSLQRQVEFLSMKLSSVNTRLDGNIDTLMSKDVFQPNNSMSMQQQLDSSAQSIFGHQTLQNQGLHCNISSGPMSHCPIDTLDTSLCQNLGINGFSDIVSQYQIFGEDELQSIVQMGYGQIPNREASLQPQSIHGPNRGSHMKIEL